ncbi:hypothetical protein [Enterocloster lavalensis]|nr:hypothetical protein [Enterocloster lavalensis]
MIGLPDPYYGDEVYACLFPTRSAHKPIRRSELRRMAAEALGLKT